MQNMVSSVLCFVFSTIHPPKCLATQKSDADCAIHFRILTKCWWLKLCAMENISSILDSLSFPQKVCAVKMVWNSTAQISKFTKVELYA